MVLVGYAVVRKKRHLLVCQPELFLHHNAPERGEAFADTFYDEHCTQQVDRIGLAGLMKHKRRKCLTTNVFLGMQQVVDVFAKRFVVAFQHLVVFVFGGSMHNERRAQLEQIDADIGSRSGNPLRAVDHLLSEVF